MTPTIRAALIVAIEHLYDAQHGVNSADSLSSAIAIIDAVLSEQPVAESLTLNLTEWEIVRDFLHNDPCEHEEHIALLARAEKILREQPPAPEHKRPRVLNKRTALISPDAVYVGRPSKWGNPFKIGTHGNRDDVIREYRKWLMTSGDGQRLAGAARLELRGKDLVCWCAPQPCHADVLLEVANEQTD